MRKSRVVAASFVGWLGKAQLEDIFLQFNRAQKINVMFGRLHDWGKTSIFGLEVFVNSFLTDRHCQKLIGVGARLSIHLEHCFDKLAHVHAVVRRDRRIHTFKHLFEEAIHIVCSERRNKCAHLVDHATEGPNVGLQIVGLIFPHFGACIVRGSCLRVEEALFGYFGNVEVAEFCCAVAVEENVCALHVSVQNFEFVKGLESLDDLEKDFPDSFFLHELL